MKKAKMIGKKTLSVFLAVLMVLTAWVWVAPTEASAVNSSGNYTWRLYINCTNAYTGNAAYYTVTGKTNNGQGTDTTISNQTTIAVGSGSIFDEGTNAYFPSSDGTTSAAFPYKVYIHTYKNSGLDFWPGQTDGSYSAELQVKDSSGSWKTVCSGDSGVTHGHGNVDLTISDATNNYPSPSSIKWETENTADTADLTIDKKDNVTRTLKFNVYDQYGVRMSSAALTALNKAPTATVTASQSGALGTSTSSNIYYTLSSSNTDAYYITVTAKPGAKSTIYDSQTITVSASCNSKSLTNRAFTLYDPMYKFTLDPNGGGMITPTTDIEKRYHNSFGYTPDASRTGFSLIGFYTTCYDDSYESSNVSSSDSKLTSTTYIDSDLTWYAAWQANQYKMKFTYRDENSNWVTTDEVTEYFGRDIPLPEVQKTINGVDYTYSFTGWSPNYTTVQAVDGVTEYIAQYDTVIHYAVLDYLQGAIAEAKAKQDTALYKENAYTDSTVTTFEEALRLAEMTVERKPLLSEQSYVDALAQTLNNANSNLDIKNYTVIFVDEDGTILKDGYFFVTHGATVTIPSNPKKASDETNHYTFGGWDSEESDSLDACDHVTNNLIYVASFNKEAHTFTETVTPSTCTEAGVITRTCECGYSYTVAGDKADHTWSTNYKELIPATCNTTGIEAIYCTECGAIDESSKKEIAMLGHNFGEYEEYTPATCFANGSEVAECSRCGGKNVRKLAQKTHAYGTAEEIEKTCTTDGYIKEVCTLCGFTNIRDIDKATGHSISTTTVGSTCVSSGYTMEDCANCDYEKTTILPATGNHTYPEIWEKVSDATCVGHGVEKRVCTVCNGATETRLTDLVEHTKPSDWTTEVEPWCDSNGKKVKNCTVCGKELESETITKLGHAYEVYAEGTYAATCETAGANAEKCSRCGDINTTVIQPSGHKWDDGVIVNATCEKDGSETYKCQNCDKTNVVVIPKLGHDWSEWTVVPSKNGEVGSVSRTCKRETCKKVESIEIPAGNHNLTETARTNSSCVTPGSVTYTCQVAHENGACGISVTVELPLAEHTIVTYEEVATCTADGYIKTYCSVCNKELSKEATKKIAHVYTAGEAVAPTCTTSGYTPYKCNSCTESYNVYDATKPATGHDFDETIATNVTKTEATCTVDGSKKVKCKNCDVYNIVVIPATGHSHVKDTVTAANCTTAGTEVYKCACGDTYTKFIEAAKGHTFGDWTTTQAATADQYGIQERTCSACNTVEIGKVAPIGNHTFVEEVTMEATCTAKGEKSFTCSAHENCSANYTAEIPAKGHTQTIDYKAPTCVANGYSRIVCSVESCKAEIMSAEILAKGHAYNTVKVTTEAGCESTGIRTYSCSCGASYTETIPSKGHNYVSTVTVATCEKAGEVVTTCSSCGDTTTETLAALNHKWNEGVENPKATCTSTGTMTYTCDICNNTKTERVEMLDHSWGDWTVTSSTNNDKGYVKRECDNCDAEESVEIPAGNHNLVVGSKTDATCTNEGTITYICENHKGNANCGVTLTVTVPATGHNVNVTTAQADCTNDGSVVETCKYCNTVIKTTSIPAKGHTVTVTTTPATCIKEGSVVEDCDNCDYKVTTPLLMIPHDYSGTETATKKATCTEDGSKTIECKTEGCNKTTTVVIPKLGHSWSGWVKKEATNDTDGSWYHKCANCGIEENLPIPAGGHKFGDKPDTIVAATCTKEGSATYKCTAHTGEKSCGVTITVKLDFAPHTIAQRVFDATCTSKGSVKIYCSVCDKDCENSFNSVEIPEKAHVYVAQTAVDPTCTTSGYTPYKCSCGDTYNVYDATKPANGHTLVEGTSTATCTAGGAMTLTCKVSGCDYSATVNVPALGHNYVENEKAATEATCAAAATKIYECSRCTASYTISVGEKLTNYDAHQWTAWITVESATNTSLGYKTRTCEVCNKMEVETIAATGEHKFDKLISEKAATCEDAGEKIYACSTHTACGETSTVTIPATGHTEKHDYKAATCTDAGYSRMYCETCTVDLSKETIPALGHDWNDGAITNATCKTEGKIVRTCSRGCKETNVTTIPVNSNAHQYATEYIAATCYKEGSVVTKCKLCGNTTTNETLAKIEHTWDSGSETKAATCLDVGIKTYKCACGATKTEDIPALGHNWSTWTETKASTNNDKGEMKRTCERKGCTASETVEIPAGGHKFENAPVINKEASCTAEGSATYKCSAHENCGVEVDVVLPMLQHELEKSEQAVTCDTDGFVTVKCKNCDTATYTTVIPKTGCIWNKGEITKAATCTEEGTMTFTCAYNAEHKYTKVIAKTQHNYKAGTPVAATCTSNGYTPYKCKTCDSSYVILDAAAPAKGHTFNTVVSSTANCTEGGVMTLKCACGKTMETQVPALGHDYQFSVATMATCAEAATETFKCSRCADSYTVSVGSKTNNHDWNDWVIVKATNTSLGYQTRTCKACDKLELEIIPATGEHNFNILDTEKSYKATCVKEGLEVYKCSTHENCTETSSVVIPAKGHTEQLSYTAPSCTAEGSTSIYCDECNTTIKSEKIDKLDHVFEVESIKSATCKTEGLITLGCKNCDETKTQTIVVDSTAHKLKTTVNLATCKKAGSVTVTCENGCTYKEETSIPMLQHSWGEWKVTTASTNSTDGEMTRYCGSGCSEIVKIPAGGHAFGDTPDSTTPASCTSEGTATYKCTAHTNCGVTITVKTGKLQHTLVTDSKDSSCTESGYVKVYCSECKKEYSNMTFGKLAHEYTVVVKKFDATCTTAGHTVLKCENCDEQYDRFDANPVPHKYENEGAKVTVAPTCTEMGYTTYTCDVCKVAYSTAFVKPTGHTFDDTNADKVAITPADCETDGKKVVTCKDCDAEIETVLPATGHDYDANNDGKINLDDAEMIDGEFVYVCQNAGCSHKVKAEDDEDDTDSYVVRFFDGNGKQVGEDRIVLAGEKATAPAETPVKDADGNYHYTFSGWDRDFGKIDKDLDVYATFEREAHYGGEAVCYAKAVCDKCGSGYGEFDATKHIIVTKSKSATCEADGWIEYYCSVEICGYHYSTGNYLKKETIGASGHVYGQWTIVQNGTCEIPQIQQRRCVNVGCNKIDEKRTQSTHTWMIEPKINPTCSSVGYTEFKYCLTCNLQIDRVEIPKTDHKDLDGNGYCDYCGTSKGTPKCNCMCHSTGIMKLFYGIVKFFWKLTKSSRSCSCGAVHY